MFSPHRRSFFVITSLILFSSYTLANIKKAFPDIIIYHIERYKKSSLPGLEEENHLALANVIYPYGVYKCSKKVQLQRLSYLLEKAEKHCKKNNPTVIMAKKLYKELNQLELTNDTAS